MARCLYTLLFYAITPLLLLRLLVRARKAPAYGQRILERFGIFSAPILHNSIWVHSVSVGETIAAAPLIKELQQRYPNSPLVVTTMTPTGSERVEALFGDSVFHVYAPYDLPGSITRFLKRVQPQLLIIMETELWPNTIHYCRKNDVSVVVANARLSEKSARGYQRLSALTRSMLENTTKVVAQNKADADRFLALGIESNKVEVSGSIKFDVVIDQKSIVKAAQLKSSWNDNGQRLILVAASTHEGEDAIILRAFKRVLGKHPNLLLVLVPRHPERFISVAKLAKDSGLEVECRSKANKVARTTQVLIGDSMGELLLFYGCADIVFVGGSLVNSGGHNMLEPAAWGLPIISGKSDFNFLEISRLLQQGTALLTIKNSEELSTKFELLAESDILRKQMGDNAKAIVAANRGSLGRLVAAIDDTINED
jgi:3-deoxy-D-manno-octulosonic-acid transferase